MVPERDKMIWMLRTMLTIRGFEYRFAEVAKAGKTPGGGHLYVGQEAVATGVCANLRKDDYITSTHRGHGHCIAKGADLKFMMAELFGKRTGYCKGKGGSMHIADLDTGNLGANGIVGAGIPIATGAGLSAKYRGTDQVCACFFGDGAANQGAFHEGLNLASLWKLPVIYVCENNLYGEFTHWTYHRKVEDVTARAEGYGMPGVIVDGNDILAVYETVGQAVKRAKNGEGPTLVECKTYRWEGHFLGDPQVYRTQDEVNEWKQRCPIERLKTTMIRQELLTEEEYKAMEEEIQGQIDEAVEFAEQSPFPAPEETLEDVYTV
ncbi:MAG: thiamine pyrophosphate-dependent dehydrogenase E1 component subunit alpha [Candidatus Tectomicrobia bacterium]|nr:thiamine pyrophosphate-dependent dehydrogenase E1 component subunit alpha [Candidatus Tectomicrobia bacterium]